MYKIFEYSRYYRSTNIDNSDELLKLLNNKWKIVRADSLSVSTTGNSRDVEYGKIIYILYKEPEFSSSGGFINE